MKNKKYIIIAYIFLSFILCILIYNKQYSICNNDESIIKALSNWHLKNEFIVVQNMKLEKSKDIGREHILLYMFKENNKQIINSAIFIKGFNNKYQIIQTSRWGNSNYIDERVKTNKGFYSVIIGENVNNEISSITLIIESNTYNFQVDNEKYFIKCIKLKKKSYSPANILFFDKKNNDISKKIRDNYFRLGENKVIAVKERIFNYIFYIIILLIDCLLVKDGINNK